MYYKIKIKSNGSEFSLESTNKEITQREMDLYFADIFNASCDFKSKIKKVEIINKNVKSIDELESHCAKIEERFYQKPELIKTEAPKVSEYDFSCKTEAKDTQTANPTISEPSQSYGLNEVKFENSPREEITIAQNEKAQAEPDWTPIPNMPSKEYLYDIESIQVSTEETAQEHSYNIESIKTLKEEPTQENLHELESIKIAEASALQEVEEEYSYDTEATQAPNFETNTQKQSPKAELINQEQFSNQPPEAQNEIDELISLAHKKINLADTNPKIDHTLFANGKTDNTQTFGQMRENSSNEISYITHEKEKESYTESNQARLDDIFNTPRTEQMIPTPQYELNTDGIPQVSLNDIELSLESNAQETLTIKDNSSQYGTSSLDFKQFITEYAISSLSDEFIVCAFFIKNVLKKPDFTMKLINSKLYQATGKIADMSVVDELTAKEYIKVIQTDTPKIYTITTNGEMYSNSLQK